MEHAFRKLSKPFLSSVSTSSTATTWGQSVQQALSGRWDSSYSQGATGKQGRLPAAEAKERGSQHADTNFDDAAQRAIYAPQKYEAIAVMGATGSGKSTFIDHLAPGQAAIGHNLSSCTEEIRQVSCELHGKKIVLIDTPGFNDTDQHKRSDTVILEQLMTFMKNSWDDKMLLSGIIYLHPLTDARMTGSSITNLSMFRELCGEQGLKNVILATTKWQDVKPDDRERRQRELESEDGFWGPYLSSGSQVYKFMNTKESARELVSKILQLQRFLPEIQKEALQGKAVKDTAAGSFLGQALAEMRELHEKETAALRAEIARANSQNNERMKTALEKQQKRIDAEVADIVEEQRRLNESKVERLERRISELEKKDPDNYPANEARPWHLRFRCMVCEEEKTYQHGIWECPGCHFKQNNIEVD